PVACSLPPMYKSTFSQYSCACLDTNSSSLCGSIYRSQYHELPAQPGMVLSSNGNTDTLSINSLPTTLCAAVLQAHSLELPKGGCPSSVGRYFSTSGKRTGRYFFSIICGSPFT